MSALRNAAHAVALVIAGASPAFAMPVANLAGFGDRLISDESLALAQATASANYFDADALITFGALTLAALAFAGFGAFAAWRSRQVEAADPQWRETVFRAVQADLDAFAESYRHAA